MSDVLRALEGPLAPMICASEDEAHGPGCDRTARCTVNLLWLRIRDAIADTLDSVTLADLVPSAIAVEALAGGRDRERRPRTRRLTDPRP